MKKEKWAYYSSLLTAIVVLIVLLLEINITFTLIDMYGSKILLYVFYYSAALLIPLALLSSILSFRFKEKKSIKLLTNIGIVYAVVKIIIVLINSFRVFDSGLF